MRQALKTITVFFCILFFFNIFSKAITLIIDPLVYWAGKNVFYITYSFENKGFGSGDTTYNYIYLFISAAISVIGASINLLVFKNRNVNGNFIYIFILMLRMYLIFYMLIYGLSKVFVLQFPSISDYRLIQTYGDSSPMGLAWTFMQYSKYYSGFTGLIEIIGALLLINRKTLIIGAFILIGALSNVVMMNFCYDIPVKINSLHYLIASIIIFLSNYKVLHKMILIFNSEINTSFLKKKLKSNTIAFVLKFAYVLLIILLFSQIYSSNRQENKTTVSLSGIYKVDYEPGEYDYNKGREPRWKNIVIDSDKRAVIRFDNDSMKYCNLRLYNKNKKMVFEDIKTKKNQDFVFIKQSANEIVLFEISNQDTLKLFLQKENREDYLLINRGFNWINERPLNK